jgi:hypothetical protein
VEFLGMAQKIQIHDWRLERRTVYPEPNAPLRFCMPQYLLHVHTSQPKGCHSFLLGSSHLQISTVRPAIMKNFSCCPQSLQKVADLIHWNRPRPLHFICFPIYCSSIILSFDDI